MKVDWFMIAAKTQEFLLRDNLQLSTNIASSSVNSDDEIGNITNGNQRKKDMNPKA